MIKLGVQVMAHPDRAQYIPELIDRLGIGKDQVTWDQKRDRWDTGKRAWQAHDPSTTHWMVLQDDAQVCLDLILGMEAALARVPDRAIVCPFIGTRRPAQQKVQRAVQIANQMNASWVVMGPLNWGVAILTPTPIIAQMLDWCEYQKYPNYDKRIGQFFRRVKPWNTWYTWPNLVEHRETPSLIGHGPDRRSHRFIGQAMSALSVDWSGPVVDMTQPYTYTRKTWRS